MQYNQTAAAASSRECNQRMVELIALVPGPYLSERDPITKGSKLGGDVPKWDECL